MGIWPCLFPFLSAPPWFARRVVCVQMGPPDSRSSRLNWHLTAAPHNLLSPCFRLSFPRVGSSSGTSNLIQLRGHFPLHLSVSVHPVVSPSSSPCSYRAQGSSLHPRQPRALIIAPLRQPVALKSTPPPPSPVAHLHLRPLPWQHEEDIRILRFSFQALSQKRQCIRQTYGHAFKILSLFNQTHQSNAHFLFGAGGQAEATLEDRCWRKISMFLFCGCVKVITRAHRGNANWRKMRRIACKGCAQTHQGMRTADYTK